MTSKEIESNVRRIFEGFSKEEFIFYLLIAYGISKTSVTRIKNGDFNLSKVEGEILYKKKIFFKEEEPDKLLSTIETLSKEERILKHSPRFIIVTDFKTLVAKDLKTKRNLDVALDELPKYFDFFLPLAGSEVYITKNDNKADRDAAYKMAELYDKLIEANQNVYNSKENVHELNIFLSRLLFCFFAEDTEIFEEDGIFTNTLVQHTLENGSDTHIFLTDLFSRLNSNDGSLFPAYLAKFPYVNGGLFRDTINTPVFTAKARRILIELGELNWQEINPDIFGSMIQAVVLPEYRSDLGMHYTSVENILKLIRPLFLDGLYKEFEKAATETQLRKLMLRMSKIRFFDPACGSGNFLIITYKEIRLLEIKILQKIIELDSNPRIEYTQINLSQFYGIEIDGFAHEMAILSLWLAEHQMNKIFEERLYGYGQSKPILPLKESGKITKGNATRIDWKDVCPITGNDEVYIIGNPPYLGYSRQVSVQKEDMEITFTGIKNFKKLDYIACWFYNASQYIQTSNKCKYAFVTTNSITQGEQVALLWPLILNKNQEIDFAYHSFKWNNNAKGKAQVAVVIIGVRNVNDNDKFLYSQNVKQKVKNINPYLINYNNLIIRAKTSSISTFPEMIIGSKISDNGNLLLDRDEALKLIKENPIIEPFVKKYIGAQEFMDGTYRYCIHIAKETEKDAYQIDELIRRFEKVKQFRLKSKKEATKKKAVIPHFFDEDKYQKNDFILVPQTGSERRKYIPIGYFDDSYVPSNATRVIYDAKPWLFAVITSRMHIVWVKAVAGRLKTDMQYSNTLCYNTFPFPDINIRQKENLNLYVFAILDERAKHPEKTMAQLYNPDTMPAGLKKVHKELDEAIEKCYRLQPFTTDTERLEYLFKLYEEMTTKDSLFAKQKKSRTPKSKK